MIAAGVVFTKRKQMYFKQQLHYFSIYLCQLLQAFDKLVAYHYIY